MMDIKMEMFEFGYISNDYSNTSVTEKNVMTRELDKIKSRKEKEVIKKQSNEEIDKIFANVKDVYL